MADLIKLWESKEKSSQQERKYLHFDQKASILNVKKFISNPVEIGRHYFYPFIQSDIKTPRFKKDREKKERRWEPKIRRIMYASHVDSLVYSYYNILLSEKYEEKLEGQAFVDSVLAYRRLGKSNIDFAQEIFAGIGDFGECVVFAFDISDFFDSLDHEVLRSLWGYMLDTNDLSTMKDHFNVFKSLTKFAVVQKDGIEKEFDIKNRRLKGEVLYRYCSGKQFRERIRKKKLIKTNCESKGIPQGSPISALLSNIYMFNFDKTLHDKVRVQHSGIYRRYCDDILVVCKPLDAEQIEKWILNEIKNFKLEIQEKKTDKFQLIDKDRKGIVRPINIKTGKRQNIQYLGFEYDGDSIFIRSSSVSRYYRRMKYRVHSAVWDALKRRSGKVFQKKLLLKNTEHGERISKNDYKELSKTNPRLAEKRKFKGNFITYAKRSAKKMREDKILKQIKPHRKILRKTISEKLKVVVKKLKK